MSTETAKEAELVALVTELQANLKTLRGRLTEAEKRANIAWAKVTVNMDTRLVAALNEAGDALAKVQPAIDPACGWALDIVPEAERRIAAAIAEVVDE